MTDLRTAAQQALEAMHCAVPTGKITLADWMKANRDLEAALAEPAQQGCDHCNQPLYAAIKCRVCGRETPIIEPEINGDNEPVAWIHTDPDNPRVKFLEWREDEPGYRGRWVKTPLYTSTQQ